MTLEMLSPWNAPSIKRLFRWMITLSTIRICAVSFMPMLRARLWQYENGGTSSSEKYESEKRLPCRTLLNAGSTTERHNHKDGNIEQKDPNSQRLQYLYEENVDRPYFEEHPDVDGPASPVARS